MNNGRAAIVGAGMSGLSAARILTRSGLEVRVFEKSRGRGGRMATRRSTGFEFDHGAQYFTARDEAFVRAVSTWVDEEVAAPWVGRVVELANGTIKLKGEQPCRYVGIPRMNSVCGHLARDFDISFETRVTGLLRRKGRWYLRLNQEDHPKPFDVLILTTPPAQAADLLQEQQPFGELLETKMNPCWAVMVAFEHPLELAFDGAFVNNSSLSWISRNSSKPGRGDAECWVLHGSPAWSRDHVEAEREWVAEQLLRRFFRDTGCEDAPVAWIGAHRWRYAQTAQPLDSGYLWDAGTCLGVCGDWCNGSRVEGAFLSGRALGKAIIQG